MTNQEASPSVTSDGLAGLGARLSSVIAHLVVNQSEFARRLDASPGFVSDIVRSVKKPGAEFLASVKQVFGVSIDWLLTGEGTMFGGTGIKLDLLNEIRLHVAVARASVVESDPVATALLLLIRDGRMSEAATDPTLRVYLDQLCPEDANFKLITTLYNGHLGSSDPATQQRNLLAAAIAHFEAHKPVDKIAALSKASGAAIQINIGRNQRNAGRDFIDD